MSLTAYIVFIVRNIQEIHSDPAEVKRKASLKAANEFIKVLDLEDEDIIIDFLGQAGDLTLYTTGVITLDDFAAWKAEFLPQWKAMAYEVLGPDCKPLLEIEHPSGTSDFYE